MPNRKISSIIKGRPVIASSAETSAFDAAVSMSKNKVGSILVVDSGALVGIFTERDLLSRVVAKGVDPKTVTLAEVMTANPVPISPDKPFSHAMHMMFEGGYRHVPVAVDGVAVGVVSARDAVWREAEEFEREMDIKTHILELM